MSADRSASRDDPTASGDSTTSGDPPAPGDPTASGDSTPSGDPAAPGDPATSDDPITSGDGPTVGDSAAAGDQPADSSQTAAAPAPVRWRRPGWIVAVIAVLALVAVGAVVWLPSVWDESPEDVVAGYLDALRNGDLAAATAYTDHLDLDDADSELLAEAALSGDWRVARLARSHPEDVDPATVDVTIESADGRTAQGRFELVESSQGWEIRNPLVKLDLTLLPVGFAEFNGVVTESATAWMFPGAYAAYPSYADLYQPAVSSYVAVPRGGSDDEYPETAFIPLFTVTDALNEVANEQVAAWIDRCAESTAPSPAGCPFAAANGLEGEFSAGVSVGTDRYYLDEVSWEVVEYPQVRLQQAESGFAVQVVIPGEMTVSGTDEDGTDFTGGCGVSLSHGFAAGVIVRPGPTGPWSLSAAVAFTCSSNRHPD